MTDDERDEIKRLRRRLGEVRHSHHDAWLGGISIGGGFAMRDAQIRLEEEAQQIGARLIELGEDPAD
ncbi:hypothetical protein [Microbacterium galbinum]|uniref:hypothetical protein n=1 Tax=Microbacterium galbinum TaxID=2851646 RepID=UPI001FFC4010|nr:hypothetical protein [Microbacterium galbinum]MCK2031248.1 hypothetical protein [Microbacterium galbinum]